MKIPYTIMFDFRDPERVAAANAWAESVGGKPCDGNCLSEGCPAR